MTEERKISRISTATEALRLLVTREFGDCFLTVAEALLPTITRRPEFPVNHMVVVKQHILDKYPWVALELYKAFSRSKDLAFEQARTAGAGYFFFVEEIVKQQAALLGNDPYPLGIRANVRMLDILMQASFKEGLTKKLARVDEIFYPTTLDT